MRKGSERMSRPWLKFFPADWLKDLALQSCSWEARGVHINAICYLHQSQKYGRFIIKGKPMTIERIARILAAPEALLHELIEADVLKISQRRKVVFSSRMVRDEHYRLRWAREKRKQREKLSGKTKGGQRPIVRPLSAPYSESETQTIGRSVMLPDSDNHRPADRGLTPWAEMAVATLTANLALTTAEAARQRKALAAVARRMDALDCRDSLLRELAAQAVAARSGRRTRKPVAMWQAVANEILATAEAKAKEASNGKAH